MPQHGAAIDGFWTFGLETGELYCDDNEMIFHSLEPDAPLAEFVESIFHLKDYVPEHTTERIVPDGSASIVIELDGQKRWITDNKTRSPAEYFEGQWVSGPHCNHFCISAVQNTELLAIRFRPGGLLPLLRTDVTEFCERVVDAGNLVDGAICMLRSEVQKLATSEQKVRLVEQFLLQNCDFSLKPPASISHAIQRIQDDSTHSKLSDLVDASGYSRKHFIHLFRKHIGLRPKDFQRILRFSKALAQIQSRGAVNWAGVSTDCGYSDQSHLIRDFRHPVALLD